MKRRGNYGNEALEEARKKLSALRTSAEKRPRYNQATLIAQLSSEIEELLAMGVTLEEISGTLRSGDPLLALDVTAPTLKRYYYQAKGASKKTRSQAKAGIPKSAIRRPNIEATHERSTTRRHTASKGFTSMPGDGKL